MTIAFVPPKSTDASLHHVRQGTQAALAPMHELRMCPPEYRVASKTRRREILKEWLAGCDILMGCPDTDVLQVRQELDRCIPWALFMLGRMSRGAPTMGMRSRYLDTPDVLVCTCTADSVLSTKFFPNATVAVVPLALDETLFSGADATLRTATRASLGIGPDEKVLLYAGRLSLEKNVHALLKTFRVVLSAMPDARLVIAGREANRPFGEFGTFCLGMERMLKRFCAEVGLDSGRVLFLGQQTAKDLHLVYGAADLLVNLTLNHDENFGYSQVEAMACGVPVVGSTWVLRDRSKLESDRLERAASYIARCTQRIVPDARIEALPREPDDNPVLDCASARERRPPWSPATVIGAARERCRQCGE